MSRIVAAGSLVFDQVDVFLPGPGENRVTGLDTGAVTFSVFVNNVVLPWPLSEGAGVADISVSAGAVYFNEIAGSPGFYSSRFFPDRTGFWKLVYRFDSIGTEVSREIEVAPAGLFEPAPKGALQASFTR